MISHAYMRQNDEPMNVKGSWYKFWIRRFFRIAPAYYLSLFVAILLSDYFLGGYHLLQTINQERWSSTIIYNPDRIVFSIENIVLHITFLFGLHPEYSFSTFLPDWSLGLEMQFYFIFPFLFLTIVRYGAGKSIFIIGVVSAISGFFISEVVTYYEQSLLVLKLQYFLVGILLFYLLNNRMSNLKNWLLYLLAILLLNLEDYGSQRILPNFIFHAILILGWLEIHNTLPDIISRIINNRIINLMSDSSYSVYLFHTFFISLSGILITNIDILYRSTFFIHTMFMFMFIFVLLTTYPLAYLIYLYIEKPGINLGKYFIKKQSQELGSV